LLGRIAAPRHRPLFRLATFHFLSRSASADRPPAFTAHARPWGGFRGCRPAALRSRPRSLPPCSSAAHQTGGHPGDLRRAPRRRVGAGDLKTCRVRAVLVTGRADRRCTRTRGLGARFTPVTQAGERPAEGAFRASACVTACTDRAALLRSSAGRTRSPRPSPSEFPPLARWPHTARRARDASPHACPTVLGAHRR
jgi:hypothetical protein